MNTEFVQWFLPHLGLFVCMKIIPFCVTQIEQLPDASERDVQKLWLRIRYSAQQGKMSSLP